MAFPFDLIFIAVVGLLGILIGVCIQAFLVGRKLNDIQERLSRRPGQEPTRKHEGKRAQEATAELVDMKSKVDQIYQWVESQRQQNITRRPSQEPRSDPVALAKPPLRREQQAVVDLFNSRPEEFERYRQPVSIGLVGRPSPNELPFFNNSDAGSFWLFRGDAGEYLVAPHPRISVTTTTYHDAGLKAMFNCVGYQDDRRYSGFRLVRPAAVCQEGDGWRATSKGELELVTGAGA
jgi:hypothetical protein